MTKVIFSGVKLIAKRKNFLKTSQKKLEKCFERISFLSNTKSMATTLKVEHFAFLIFCGVFKKFFLLFYYAAQYFVVKCGYFPIGV